MQGRNREADVENGHVDTEGGEGRVGRTGRLGLTKCTLLGLPRWLSGKESTCQCRRNRRHRFNPWITKIPWKRKWQPPPVFLPGKIPWTEQPGGLQSMGSQKSHTRLSDYTTTYTHHHVQNSMETCCIAQVAQPSTLW